MSVRLGPRSPASRRLNAGTIRLGAITLCALFAGNVLAQALRAARDWVDTDYVSAFNLGAHMLRAHVPCLYCIDAQRDFQLSIVGFRPQTGTNAYTNPPLAAWLIQPLSFLTPRAGLAVFLSLSVGALLIAGALIARHLLPAALRGPRRSIVLAAAVLSLPGAQTLATAQWDTFLLLAAVLAVVCVERRRPFTAGLLLGMLFVKPQLIWVLPIVLLAARQWRVLAGLIVAGGLWAVTSLAILGPSHVSDWPAHMLSRHVGEAWETIGLPGIVGSLTSSGAAAFAASGALLVIAAGVAWRLRDRIRADGGAVIGLGLAASILLAPHIWPDDLLLAAVPIALWSRYDAWRAALGGLALNAAYLLDISAPQRLAHAEALAVTALVVGLTRAMLNGKGASAGPDLEGAPELALALP